MVNQQLLDYVKQQVAAGVAKEDIKKALVIQGWTEQDTQEAFAAVAPTPLASPSTPQPKTTISSAPTANTRWVLIIASAVVGLVVVGGGGAYFYIQTNHHTTPTGPPAIETTPTPPATSATSTPGDLASSTPTSTSTTTSTSSAAFGKP